MSEDLVNFFEEKRRDFPIFKNNEDLIYFDSAATTQKPKLVIDSVVNFYESYNSNIHRGVYKISQKASEEFERTRFKVADFLNCREDEIFFTSGVTEGINGIAQMLKRNFNRGDEIILSVLEHHSNIVVWQEIARELGLVLRYVDLDEDFRVDLRKLEELVSSRTKLICISHVSNVVGVVNDIEAVGRIVERYDVLVLVDGSQSVGHIGIDLKKLSCDFFVFGGHKMLGPSGVGVVYGKFEILSDFSSFKFGGGMIERVEREVSTYRDIPYRFEAGTPNIEGVIGLGFAIDYLREVGFSRIERYEKFLSEYFLEKIEKLDYVEVLGSRDMFMRIGIFSFRVKDIHSHDVASIFDKYNIALRSGQHCTMPLHVDNGFDSTSRISFYFYNLKEEVDRAVWVLENIYSLYEKGEHLL